MRSGTAGAILWGMADGTRPGGRTDGSGRGIPQPHREPQTDYGGAVYGSLQAASVVAGTAAFGPFPRLGLVLLLLITGLVFWMAHVYARLVGDLASYRDLTWQRIRHVAGDEWPIAQAAVGPAVAVVISPLLGLGVAATAWFALSVAVAEQVGWACYAAIRAGASRRLVVLSTLANLVLGLIIVVLKAKLH
ncbi:hypothetical protein [Streptomyces noursei]|uniref:hypothetical protein n=1 Tax=Streptomyces noursei TaxID=1971 RepID=UPI00045EF804|nr:hypothetical protein [Streptomyces noursei]AIA01104.1 hypothetical protein DC74_578 [Streptomyces noursei]